MSTRVLAFANQKGGVGKTTSCVNLAAALAVSGTKVLVIDLDPQGNATMGSGIDKSTVTYSANDVLQKDLDITDAIIMDTPGGYSLLPANSDLTVAEVILLREPEQERNLKEAIQKIRHRYAFILIDCPPSLNMLTLNALVAADAVIVPMQCEYYALEGLSALLNTIEQVQQNLNPNLTVEGILRTMYDPRNRLATEVSAQLIAHFGNKVYQTVIPRNVRLAEAPSHGLPILLYDKTSKGSEAYIALAKELLKHRNKKIAEKEMAAM